MSNKEPGYVYILTNPSFREDWVKIGKSSRPVGEGKVDIKFMILIALSQKK